MKRRCSAERIAKIIREGLERGHLVNIEGFGTFRPGANGFEFEAEMRPRVFLAYVREDLRAARRLYRDLKKAGYQPWLDKENLLAGQDWPRAIDRAIEIADFFIPCFSKRSVQKRGVFQSELRFALDCASRLPLDDVYLIPVRLDDCAVPDRIQHQVQQVDLFPSWEEGVAHIRKTIDLEQARRANRDLRLAS